MRTFINDNEITFLIGERNASVVTVVGYAQFKGVDKPELKVVLAKEIKKDKFIAEEIDRIWDYCKSNKYEKFWKTKAAKNQYKF